MKKEEEKVNYLNLPCPIPYEEIHREALSLSLFLLVSLSSILFFAFAVLRFLVGIDAFMVSIWRFTWLHFNFEPIGYNILALNYFLCAWTEGDLLLYYGNLGSGVRIAKTVKTGFNFFLVFVLILIIFIDAKLEGYGVCWEWVFVWNSVFKARTIWRDALWFYQGTQSEVLTKSQVALAF